MKIHLIGDTHFGHKNIIRLDGRPFESVEEMDEYIIKVWNERVRPEDEVYIAGDFSWYGKEKTDEILSRLNGKKFLIRGNHDKFNRDNRPNYDLVLGEKYSFKHNGYKVIINHVPELFYVGDTKDNVIMVYAHIHNSLEEVLCEKAKAFILEEAKKLGYPMKMQAYNVGCMHHGYGPVLLDDLIEKTQKKKGR